jgi:hypothetical protein
MVSKVDPIKAQMEQQEWWKKKVPEYCEVLRGNESYREEESHPTEEPWASLDQQSAHDTLIQVGLFGSRELFKQIPTCLRSDIQNGIPPYRISRIALQREEGGVEQLLIQGVDGEQMLLTKDLVRMRYGGREWRWVIDGEVRFNSSIWRQDPSLMCMSGHFELILEMIAEIQKAESVIRETLGVGGKLPHGVQTIILSYDHYATPQEKASAESNRQQVLNKIEEGVGHTFYPSLPEYPSRRRYDAIVKDLSPPTEPAKPQGAWAKFKNALGWK